LKREWFDELEERQEDEPGEKLMGRGWLWKRFMGTWNS
jgi:hypothetical protein